MQLSSTSLCLGTPSRIWHGSLNLISVQSFYFLFRFINARRRIVQPMIDASSRAGKTPVITVFKSRKRKMHSPDSLPTEPCYPVGLSHYQQPSVFHQDYHHQAGHPGYYGNLNLPANNLQSAPHQSCQYLSGFPVDGSQGVPTVPSCMDTRPQVMPAPYGHWMSNSHPQFCPSYSSDSQIQNGQFYVKASWLQVSIIFNLI